MKKILVLSAIILMGVFQRMNAQSEADYSLDGIGKTLNTLKMISQGLCLGNFHEGLAWVRVSTDETDKLGQKDLYGYIDNKGNMVIPCVYDSKQNFSDGCALVRDKNLKYSVIDKQGNTVITLKKGEKIGRFSEGLAVINKNDSVGYINKNGELVIPYFEGSATSFQDGFSLVYTQEIINGKKSLKISLLDKKGNKKDFSTLPLRSFGYKDGYFIMRSDEGSKFGVLDTNGNIVVPFEYNDISSFSDGLFLVRRNGYGYVNAQGKVVIPLDYKHARPFSEGMAAVEKDGKWGYINKQGKISIPLQYEKAFDFHDGRAFIKTNNGYALINMQGQIVSPSVNYDYFGGDEFSEGLAVINLNGRWGYVDIYGNNTLTYK